MTTCTARFFRGSAIAKPIMWLYGLLVLTPPRVWKQTHNYHHAHNAKIVGSHVGSYPVMTVSMWHRATAVQRLLYRASRHPLAILFGYFSVFLYGMCISGFLRRPSRNWDSLLALSLNVALMLGLLVWAGLDVLFFSMVLPLLVSCATGAYLFYAQHNFEGMHLQGRDEWSYTRAAIESSSYMKMNPIARWFAGNIGYHHVHHLNPSIPFYRLPEALEALPELRAAQVTTLRLSDIAACFRLNLWDPDQGKMVAFPQRLR